MRFKRCFLLATVLMILIRDVQSVSVKREVTEFSDFFNRRANGFPEARIVKVPCQTGYRDIGGKCRKVYYR